MTVHIYDGMNVIRRGLIDDPTGRFQRTTMINAFLPGPHLWVWDGVGGNDRRRALYPEYKLRRNPQPDEVWQTINLMKEVLGSTPAIQVKVDTYEADDVIATLTKHWGYDVYIHSSDADFSQLGVRGDFKPKVETQDVRLYKTCVGDPSDNIKGIPGFGKTRWMETDREKLRTIVNQIITNIPLDSEMVKETFPRARAISNWLLSVDNHSVVKKYWEIIGFFEVPMGDINSNMRVGIPDRPAANALLDQYML